jgi:signal transduction histidine kinase
VAAHDLRNPIAVMKASAQMAQRQMRRGDLDAAEQLARDAVALAERTDFLDLHGTALMDLADVLLQARRPAEAAAASGAALVLYQQKGNLVSAARARAAAQSASFAPA